MTESGQRKGNHKVDVIIPNWNGKDVIGACLDSLMDSSFEDFLITVVENGSQDGSVDFLRERYPQVALEILPSNIGFAAGVNHGIRATSAPLVALLNNDMTVEPDWLDHLVRAIDADSRLGSCASKILWMDEPDVIYSAGDGYSAGGYSVMLRCGEPDTADSSPTRIFSSCGGASIFRRDAMEQVGCFDESYFAHAEDVDLGFRLRLAGYDALLVPQARAYHKGGRSSNPGSLKFILRTHRNGAMTFVKNYPSPLLKRNRALIFRTAIAAILYVRPRLAGAAGLLNGLIRTPWLMKERRRIQGSIQADLDDLDQLMKSYHPPFRVSP